MNDRKFLRGNLKRDLKRRFARWLYEILLLLENLKRISSQMFISYKIQYPEIKLNVIVRPPEYLCEIKYLRIRLTETEFKSVISYFLLFQV